jgi:hypothetical protein
VKVDGCTVQVCGHSATKHTASRYSDVYIPSGLRLCTNIITDAGYMIQRVVHPPDGRRWNR